MISKTGRVNWQGLEPRIGAMPAMATTIRG
jgi:hypothetical protein